MRSERKMKSTSEKIKNVFRKIGKFIKITALTALTMTIIAGGYVLVKAKPIYDKMAMDADKIVESINDNTFKRLDPTLIVRNNGDIVREFEHAPYIYIKGDEIPTDVKEAFVSIEDKKFYSHKGVDLKANIRAAVSIISNDGEITQGGSTITQQLVKNIFLTNEQSYERKIREVLIALRIERQLSKDEILEYYINNIYFGNGAYGVETAADYYFSKSVKDLSLSEIAFLASIPNNPTLYNPLDNKENTIKRRDRILTHMMEDEIISEEQMSSEKSVDIELEIRPKEEYISEDYEVTYLMSSAIKLIMENEGFELKYKFNSDDERESYNIKFSERFDEVNTKVRSGGYKITSTIDPVKQEQLQSSINKELSAFTNVNQESGIYQTQSAGVSIDNETNELIAIVGGRTQDDVNNTFNRAFLAYRQPASAIKPIVSYGPEIDNGLLGEDLLMDKQYPKGPRNVTRSYQGNVTAREALEKSINTIPFELMRVSGTKQAKEYMANLEFAKIVDGDSNAGIAIGGFTYGTSPLEMGGAYATLANDGKYVRLTGISEITFNNKDSIYENEKVARPVYKDGTAYLITDMLKGVMTKSHGTGYKRQLGKQPSAGKSGTSSDNKDGWFAGYTPYYTTVIWVGNDDAKPLETLYGSTYPGRIWQNFMIKAHEGLEVKDFQMPDGTKKMYLNPNNRYVSESKKSGYTRYEIIPSHFREMMEKEEAEQIRLARLAELERERKEKEERDRIAKEELERKQRFKDEYGVEEDVELANQANTSRLYNSALNMSINSNDDYINAVELLDNAKISLDKIAVESFYNEMNGKIDRTYDTINSRKTMMEERLEQEKIDQERLKKEREEELKLKEKRLEQEKIDQEKAEKERLEQEKIDNQKPEVNNPSPEVDTKPEDTTEPTEPDKDSSDKSENKEENKNE